jgi:hypothetical protein
LPLKLIKVFLPFLLHRFRINAWMLGKKPCRRGAFNVNNIDDQQQAAPASLAIHGIGLRVARINHSRFHGLLDTNWATV